MIRTARELLGGGETALVIYTDGRNLELDAPDGEASSGRWHIADHRTPDRVIIYRKNATHDTPEKR